MSKYYIRFVLSVVIWFTAVILSAAQQPVAKPFAADLPSQAATANTKTSIPPSIDLKDFVIGPDDVLFVQVWKEPEVTRTVTVRPDGKVSLALIGEVTAAGKTPKQLEADIATKLGAFMADATVSVIVQEIRSLQFTVLGKVAHPGTYPLNRSLTVLDAIALAGGFRDFARQGSIYVLRQGANGQQQRLAFNYKEVIAGRKPYQNVALQPKDTVVVP
jgi:polysaccharide biosynthesis/export protein